MPSFFIFRRLHFIGFILLITFAARGYSSDPYAILGVRRNASSSEIKQAYKKLARMWHPDTNNAPAAEGHFLELSRAYGLLSNPELKAQYDRYGGFEKEKEDKSERADRNPFADFYFGSFGQSQYQFHNAPNFFKKHDVGIRVYDGVLVNNSHTKPYLVFVYADWCQSCMRAERLWERIVSVLEPEGYGIATINSKMEGTLVERLRVRQLPAVLALVDGRPIHYRDRAIDAKGLLEFARLVLPKTYVAALNDVNYRKFLEDSWRRNKVSAIMCGPNDGPDARLILAAMRYRSYFSFGYVPANTAASLEFRATYMLSSAKTNMQTFMLFDERVKAPLVMVQADEVSAASINVSMESNKYLILPRLSSQRYLDDLCPNGKPRQFCVILLARANGINGDDGHVTGFRDTVAAKRRGVNGVRYVYVYEDRQPAFVESLEAVNSEKSANVVGDRRHVVIVWRPSVQRAKVLWLRHLWAGNPETVNRSAELVLAKVDSILRGNADSEAQISSIREVTLKGLIDEDSPPVYKRLASKVARSWATFLHHVGNDEFLPAISILGTLLFMLLIGYGLNYIVDTEKKAEEEKRRRKERGKPIEETKEYKSLIRELRAETYFGMVRMLKPGFRSVVVLVDAETKDVLVKQFGQAIWPWRKNKTLLFGYVTVEKNLDWFRQLLELALADPDLRLKQTINPRNVIGTVLSLNGFRQFFSMYHPKHAPSMVGYKAAERRRTQDSRYFLGVESSNEDTEDELDEEGNDKRDGNEHAKEFLKTKPLKVDELLDGLPNWLERLFRGNARRYYITEWPPIR